MEDIKEPEDMVAVSKFLIAHANIASKQWVSNQYDSMVGTANMRCPRNSPHDCGSAKNDNNDKLWGLQRRLPLNPACPEQALSTPQPSHSLSSLNLS